MTKPTLLLIHGSWAGAWAWDNLAEHLDALGLKWKAVDCLGNGSKSMLGWRVSARHVADDIVEEARKIDGPVILVGHSGGCVNITNAASRAPEEFVGLIYIAGFLPKHRDRLLSMMSHNKGSDFRKLVRPNLIRGVVTLDGEKAHDFLFHDCPEEIAADYARQVCDEPIRLGSARVKLSDGFYDLPKQYIMCTSDRALTPEFQRWMIDRQPVSEVHELACGHMPMLAKPKELATVLKTICDST